MSEETPVTTHVHACVKLLNEWLQNNPAMEVQGQERSEAFEAVFELVDLPWDEHTEQDGLFREGYETCLLDVVAAVADAWGVELPKLEVQ